MKHLTILGSTGSIGQQTLDIVRAHKNEFKIETLAAGQKNLGLLAKQICEFQPKVISIPDANSANELKNLLQNQNSNYKPEILYGESSLDTVASFATTEIVVSGLVGALGIRPTAAAIKAGKTIALANKETLVAAGSLIMPMLKEYNSQIIPVDSEHSAIFQSISGYQNKDIKRILLTGSGGPFRTWTKNEIEKASLADALKHPNWAMGQKITIDSATLMNKGLEIIEAKWLFDIDVSSIEVLIHPQSILHSAVEFFDGSVIGQLGMPDMHLPIHYALFYPERKFSNQVPMLDLIKLKTLSFEEPDYAKFPCLKLAQTVALKNDSSACVLNAANEEMVFAFLRQEINFSDIAKNIEKILELHQIITKPSLDDILECDLWARQKAKELLGVKNK